MVNPNAHVGFSIGAEALMQIDALLARFPRLLSFPQVIHNSCENSCTSSCSDSCTYSCSYGCKTSCESRCKGTCAYEDYYTPDMW